MLFLRIPLPGPLFAGDSKDVFEIAMTYEQIQKETTKQTLSTHQDQTALNPGILKELKHEIGELLTQRYVTSQLRVAW